MSKTEQKEVKIEVGLPAVGFPTSMHFNRFYIEREDAFCLVQFGLVSGSGLVKSYSCVFSREMMEQNKNTLLEYLGRIGRPTMDAPIPWKGAPVEKQAEVADVVSMAFRGDTAETCLFFFSISAASRLGRAGAVNEELPAQPLALLRSTAEMQRQLIVGLYEEE